MSSARYPCNFPGCKKRCLSEGGLKRHRRRLHDIDRTPEEKELEAPEPPSDVFLTSSDIFTSDMVVQPSTPLHPHPATPGRQPEPLTPSYSHNPHNQDEHLGSPVLIPTSHPNIPQEPDHQGDLHRQCLTESDTWTSTESRPSGSPRKSRFDIPNPKLKYRYHPHINGRPCAIDGSYPANSDLPPKVSKPTPSSTDWGSFKSKAGFLLAQHLYAKVQSSGDNVDELMDIWNLTGDAPYNNHEDLYKAIDHSTVGDVPWQAFEVRYNGDDDGHDPNTPRPKWMTDSHEVYYRDPRLVIQNMLANPDFSDAFDYAPYEVVNENNERQYDNLMSGSWAWKQADEIAKDPATHGSMFVPIVLGSDKTTVSVATGQTDYYPLYLSLGNFHNNVRRAHRNSVIVIGFLAIAKTGRRHSDTAKFRLFRRQLFHTSLSRILATLRPGMTTPEIYACADGYYRRVIFGLGPYIADYPEQVLIACIVQNWCPRCTAHQANLDQPSINRVPEHANLLLEVCSSAELWKNYGMVGDVEPFTAGFPRANIYELLSPDLLHQLIKGVFKDHIVDWVVKYIEHRHSKAESKAILDDIDRRIALAPPFSGLRRFPQGRRFKQWTGDDSKALMKVYLPAIEGYVPKKMLRALRAFLEFCYIARANIITQKTLEDLEDALARFHEYRSIFEEEGIRPEGFSLPRQHAATHYSELIQAFGAPNGLCSSITEAQHINAVKDPWRRSNHNKALKQMLLTNQRLDKLAAAHIDFTERGMLDKTRLTTSLQLIEELKKAFNDDTNTESKGPAHIINDPDVLAHVELSKKHYYKGTLRTITSLIKQPRLPHLIQQFLHYQEVGSGSSDDMAGSDILIGYYPSLLNTTLSLHTSLSTIFFSPSDPCGIQGMRKERIRANPAWRGEERRYDCVLVDTGGDINQPLSGYTAARLLLLFSFRHTNKTYQCALVWWYTLSDDTEQRDEDTGMWLVERAYQGDTPHLSVIHVDTIFRAVHLLPFHGKEQVPIDLTYTASLDTFAMFYASRFADHHAFELL